MYDQGRRHMQVVKNMHLAFGALSLWASAAAANWVYLPWGASGVLVLLMIAILLVLVASVITVILARRLIAKSGRRFFIILGAGILFLTFAETLYFNMLPDDHEMLRRQVQGLWVGGVFLVLAFPGVIRLTPERAIWSWKKCINWVVALLLLSAILEILMYSLRSVFRGSIYYAIDSAMFSTAVIALVIALAIASLGRRAPLEGAP